MSQHEMDNGGPHRTNRFARLGRINRPAQRFAPPRQITLQLLDDTWERLLNAMERLEQVTEGFRSLTAGRLDRHGDRDAITEGELGVRTEVHLHLKSLRRVVQPVRAEAQWMVHDFLLWYGGRAAQPDAPADEYAMPILHCVVGMPVELPDLAEIVPTEQDILAAAEALSRAMQDSGDLEDQFAGDPDLQATRHGHARTPTPASGLVRLAVRHPALARHLAMQMDAAGAQPW